MIPYAIISLFFLIFSWFYSFWPNIQTLYIHSSSEIIIFNFFISIATLYLIIKKRVEMNFVANTSSQLGLIGLFFIICIWIMAGVNGIFDLQITLIILMIPAIFLIAFGPFVAQILIFPLLFFLLIIPFYQNHLDTHFLLWWLSIGLLIAYLRYQTFFKRIVIVIISMIIPFLIEALSKNIPREILTIVLGISFFIFIYNWKEQKFLYGIGGIQLQPGKELIESKARFLIPTIIGCSLILSAPWFSENIRGFYPQKTKSIVLQAPMSSSPWIGPLESNSDWHPQFLAPNASLKALYQNTQNIHNPYVYLFAVYYRSDRSIDDLLNSKNKLYGNGLWQNIDQKTHTITLNNDHTINVNEIVLKKDNLTRVIWSWYYIMGIPTVDLYLMQVLDKVRIISKYADGSGLIAVATDNPDNINQARESLSSFIKAMYPAFELLEHPEKLQ